MVYDRNRVYCRRYRGLTGIEGLVYDGTVLLGLPAEPEASRNGNPGEEAVKAL